MELHEMVRWRISDIARLAPVRKRRFVEACFWIAGTATLVVAAWMVGDAYVYQLRAADMLVDPADPAGTIWPTTIPDGTPIALPSIPSLDVSVAVAEGTSNTVLRRAIGHIPSSARPGQTGNVALTGHRDTFLRPLKDIRTGEIVILESPAGRDVYRVEWTAVVAPTDAGVIADAGYPALTLVTCYSFGYVGNAPERFVPRARRIDPDTVRVSREP